MRPPRVYRQLTLKLGEFLTPAGRDQLHSLTMTREEKSRRQARTQRVRRAKDYAHYFRRASGG